MISLVAFCLMVTWSVSTAYPYGPPIITKVCTTMFPFGHNVSAMEEAPPYELIVSPMNLTSLNQNFNVTLRLLGNNTKYPHFEGMFVQARMASCYKDTAIGSFSIPANDDFLKLNDCHEMPNSAVSNKDNSKQTTKTFTWTSPSSEPGHIYFRATVVKTTTVIWTNVFSETVRDVTDNSALPTVPQCGVCTDDATCTASSFVAVTSAIVASLGMALAWNYFI